METMSKGRKENQSVIEVDRISSLPDHLLHFILLLLSTGDAARMSVLSKRWDMIWTTFPIIDIDEANYGCRQNFVQALQLYLLRHDMVHLQKLRLRTILTMNEEVYHLTKRFLNVALGGNLQNLHLQFCINRVRNKMKRVCARENIVPGIVFSEGTSLRCLKLAGCDLKSYRVFNLRLLRILFLKNILIQESFVERLMQSCPALEKLCLEDYHQLKSIKIIHDRIRKFVLSISEQLETLEIHLPRLQSFKYKGYYNGVGGYMAASKFDTLNKIGVDELHSFCLMYTKLEVEIFINMQFKQLKKLILHYIEVVDEAFSFNKLRFPLLESLSLKGCKGLKNVKVMNLGIEALAILDCKDLEYCTILARNLLFFEYQGGLMDMNPLLASEKVQVNLNLPLSKYHWHDMSQSLRMTHFLRAFSGANGMTMTLVWNCCECVAKLKEVRVLPLSYVQHLEVKIKNLLEPAGPALVDLLHGLFSISYHCNTLSMDLDSFHIKFEFQGFNKEEISGTVKFHYNIAFTYVVKMWISGFSGSKEEINLVFYVLRRTANLKYISISSKAESQITYFNLKEWTKTLEETFPGVYFKSDP